MFVFVSKTVYNGTEIRRLQMKVLQLSSTNESNVSLLAWSRARYITVLVPCYTNDLGFYVALAINLL